MYHNLEKLSAKPPSLRPQPSKVNTHKDNTFLHHYPYNPPLPTPLLDIIPSSSCEPSYCQQYTASDDIFDITPKGSPHHTKRTTDTNTKSDDTMSIQARKQANQNRIREAQQNLFKGSVQTYSDDNITAKEDLTNEMVHMTGTLKSHVMGISTTLDNEKAIREAIDKGIEKTQGYLEGLTARLSSIVGGAWWDMFSNLFMLVIVLVVFFAVLSMIFVVPRAKWI